MPAQKSLVVVRPDQEVMTKQKLPYFIGISEETAGATGLSLNMIVIPPGGAAAPHIHKGYETAIYVLQGPVRTKYGAGLRKEMINESGDFLFIPADLPHQPINMRDNQRALAIVARTDPNEQESVEHYDPQAATDDDPDGEIVMIRSAAATLSKQRLEHFEGVSRDTAGSTGISMYLSVVPPGGRGMAHIHRGFESATYVIDGQLEMHYGRDLTETVTIDAGEFFFIPASLPHQPFNASDSERVLLAVARNNASEQESVVPYIRPTGSD